MAKRARKTRPKTAHRKPKPTTLTQAQVDGLFAPYLPALRKCVANSYGVFEATISVRDPAAPPVRFTGKTNQDVSRQEAACLQTAIRSLELPKLRRPHPRVGVRFEAPVKSQPPLPSRDSLLAIARSWQPALSACLRDGPAIKGNPAKPVGALVLEIELIHGKLRLLKVRASLPTLIDHLIWPKGHPKSGTPMGQKDVAVVRDRMVRCAKATRLPEKAARTASSGVARLRFDVASAKVWGAITR
ncbi:MAG: hypothetical protein B7733_04015 [Myxococcales bacterium FL481]|nr:MAG: hypothetical protein B7733_04015 [Myxococcales bacterium FL481]